MSGTSNSLIKNSLKSAGFFVFVVVSLYFVCLPVCFFLFSSLCLFKPLNNKFRTMAILNNLRQFKLFSENI